MLRFMLIRRLFKTWNRWYASRRERTPSSLHECLDPPPPRRGLWRNWFILLILIPVLYYLIFIKSERKYEEYSVPVQREVVHPFKLENEPKVDESHRENPQVKEEKNEAEIPPPERLQKSESNSPKAFYQIVKPRAQSQEYVDLHRHPASTKQLYSIENGTLIAKLDGNNTIQARVPTPARHEKIVSTTAGTIPRKYLPVCVPNHSMRKGLTTEDIDMAVNNISASMGYREKLYRGGYFVPADCQSRHKVAILVAYRKRSLNLAVFLYHIHPFLIEQGIEYRIFVVEQSGSELFNKGRLFNVGYIEAMKYGSWGCVVFHDVDLLPTNSKILYSCPTWPRHMAATIVGNRRNDTNYRSLFGGVTSMTAKQFLSVNGYSNLYWGWGGEDTDMFWRIKTTGMPIVRYSKVIAQYLALPHDQAPENPIRKQLSNNAMARIKKDGLSNLVYRLLAVTLYGTYTHFMVDVNPEHENITELQIKWGK